LDIPRNQSVPRNNIWLRNFNKQLVGMSERVHFDIEFDKGSGDIDI
jgi:hypothetical protein